MGERSHVILGKLALHTKETLCNFSKNTVARITCIGEMINSEENKNKGHKQKLVSLVQDNSYGLSSFA